MKKQILLLFVALIMLSCKDKQINSSVSNAEEVEQEIIPTVDLGCYVFNDGKNIVTLEILKNEKDVEGNLSYTLAEKDKNTGIFKGQLKGNILIGTYTFKSEGSKSSREVAFKVSSDTLIEGYGDLNEDGTAFRDITTLKFSSNVPLGKTNCN